MEQWRELAARNNAELCDAVCRSHGLSPRFDADAWTCARRTPVFYPDAVTLVPEPSLPDLLDRIDASGGASVKDSFSSLDLSDDGFRVLFDARWIACEPGATPRADGGWSVVDSVEMFAKWEESWRGSSGPEDLLRAALLDDDAIVAAAEIHDDHVFAGALFNRSEHVVGISNLFATAGSTPETWAHCLAFSEEVFPGATLVGYESGQTVAHALTAGFQDGGPLRIWIAS